LVIEERLDTKIFEQHSPSCESNTLPSINVEDTLVTFVTGHATDSGSSALLAVKIRIRVAFLASVLAVQEELRVLLVSWSTFLWTDDIWHHHFALHRETVVLVADTAGLWNGSFS